MNNVHPLMRNIQALAESKTWEQTVEAVDEAMLAWLARLKETEKSANDFSRVCFVGCGTSVYAGQVGKYAMEHLAHIPAEAIQAFTFSSYADPKVLGPDTLVVGISATGKTEAVWDAIGRAKEAGSPTLAITADPHSKLAEVADAYLFTGGKITVSVKTRTYVQSLVAIHLLALHLAEARRSATDNLSTRWREQIGLAADATRAFLDNQQDEIAALAERYQNATHVFVMAAGPNLGTAAEASLKVTEMAKMFSAPHELENFMHGRLREIDTVNPVFLLAPRGAASDRMLDFLTVMDYVQAPCIVLTQDATKSMRQLAKHVIEMPGSLDEFATPLLYITPMYLFGYHMAVLRDYDPGARRYPKIVPQNVRYGTFDKTAL